MKSPIAHEIERLESENRRLLDENARLTAELREAQMIRGVIDDCRVKANTGAVNLTTVMDTVARIEAESIAARLQKEVDDLKREIARLKRLVEREDEEGTVPCPYCQGSGALRRVKSIILPAPVMTWWDLVKIPAEALSLPSVNVNPTQRTFGTKIINTWGEDFGKGAVPVDAPPPITLPKVEPPFDDEERRKTLEAMGYGYRGGVIYNPVGVPCGVYQRPKAELAPPPPDVVVERNSLTEDFYNCVTQPVFFAELANEYVTHERRNVLNIVLPALDFIIERGDCDEAVTVRP